MPNPPKIHGQPMIRRDEESNSIILEVFIQGADEAVWYLDDQEIQSGTRDYEMTAVEHGGGQVLHQCEIKNGASLQALEGTYKAIFANAEGRFKAKFGKIEDSGLGLCRHTDTNFEACRLYTKTNFDRADFTHDHRFCMHEH